MSGLGNEVFMLPLPENSAILPTRSLYPATLITLEAVEGIVSDP
ncbi:hypothetical protein SDC9_154133 [bioreactor metagenome]|uniref:Uncharacterized protein n=1 Tax=bioreactor metagenome TaxID=1076179 RepID=A0A645EZM0_9ZZZZ